jgi:hypothetical protein
MKKGDPLQLHKERMRALHAQFLKKTQYHRQKAYLELKDIYWLVQEFFATFLDKNHHFTEEELIKELQEFKHEFIALPVEVIERWRTFFDALSKSQYGGGEPSQDQLKKLLEEFMGRVEETVGKDYSPSDGFARAVQQAQLLLSHNQPDKAEELYHKLMHEYERYAPEEKRTHFEQLNRLYQAIADVRSGKPISPQQ